MDVYFRKSVFECPAEMHVVPSIHSRRQARLHADLRRAKLARFARATDNLFNGKKVALLGEMAAAERAKTAGFDADVGKVDVPIDDVSYKISDGFRTEIVGGRDHREKIRA